MTLAQKEAKTRFNKTKRGVISVSYYNQKGNSKRRKHPPPRYEFNEFVVWVLNQEVFHKLYDIWVYSGHLKELKPSIDRKNDFYCYSFDNIQITTWEYNNRKGHDDRMNGIGTQGESFCVRVVQYTIDGEFISEYFSIGDAHRNTGVNRFDISSTCAGRLKHAGGFIWKYGKQLNKRKKLCCLK